MFRLIVLFAALATINAQYYGAPALTSQQSNIYRTFVSKSDVRVSNPGIYSGYGGYAAPALAHAAYAPAIAAGYGGYARPAVLAARPAVAAVPGSLLGVAYSAAPAVAHMSYNNGLGLSYAW